MTTETKVQIPNDTHEILFKALCNYLPYELKIQGKKHRDKYQEKPIYKLNGLAFQDCGNLQYEFVNENELFFAMSNDKNWKPILRPLSDLTKEIEHNGKKFIPKNKLTELHPNTPNFHFLFVPEHIWEYHKKDLSKSFTEYCVINTLCEWHFDVFGLIEKGLAVNKNTISNGK